MLVEFCESWLLFGMCDLEIWCMNLKNNKVPLLCLSKVCTSFDSHLGIETWFIMRKQWKRGQFVPCDLDSGWMTLKNNRAPLLCHLKLYSSFQSSFHLNWIYCLETLNLDKLCFDLGDLELWPLALSYFIDDTFVNLLLKISWAHGERNIV